MITYDIFWKTLKEKGISQYKLINHYNVSKGLLDRMKKNKPITTFSINNLCEILQCDIGDIATYIKNKENRNGQERA